MCLHKVSLITAAKLTLLLFFVIFCLSRWQQDVEEADTSAICRFPSPRSPRPAASRECVCFLCSAKRVCVGHFVNTMQHNVGHEKKWSHVLYILKRMPAKTKLLLFYVNYVIQSLVFNSELHNMQ